MEIMKICTECGTEKAMTEEFFPKNPSYTCGFGNRCKVCINNKRIADKEIRNEKNRLKTIERRKLMEERKREMKAD